MGEYNNNRERVQPIKRAASKKNRSKAVLDLIEDHVSYKSHAKMCNCYNYIKGMLDVNYDKLRVLDAFACKNRFCPICAAIKSRNDATMISMIMDYLKGEIRAEFMVLTLTMPNVTGGQLVWAINKLNKAFYKMFKRKVIKQINLGYARKLEITYNSDKIITEDMWNGTGRYTGRPMAAYYSKRGLRIGDPNPNYDTYHPHFHVIIAVSPGYIHGGKYVHQNKWLEQWRDVMDDDTITQVDIRRMFKRHYKPGTEVREVAKYAAKDSDYTGRQVVEHIEGEVKYRNRVKAQDVFDCFYTALKSRQVLTFNGCFKEALKLYKNEELEEYRPTDETVYAWVIRYGWVGNKYSERSRRTLTLDETYGNFGIPMFVEDEDEPGITWD